LDPGDVEVLRCLVLILSIHTNVTSVAAHLVTLLTPLKVGDVVEVQALGHKRTLPALEDRLVDARLGHHSGRAEASAARSSDALHTGTIVGRVVHDLLNTWIIRAFHAVLEIIELVGHFTQLEEDISSIFNVVASEVLVLVVTVLAVHTDVSMLAEQQGATTGLTELDVFDLVDIQTGFDARATLPLTCVDVLRRDFDLLPKASARQAPSPLGSRAVLVSLVQNSLLLARQLLVEQKLNEIQKNLIDPRQTFTDRSVERIWVH